MVEEDPEVVARRFVVDDEVRRRQLLADRLSAGRDLLDLAGSMAGAATDGRPVVLDLADGSNRRGRVAESGPDVVVLASEDGATELIPLDRVVVLRAERLASVEGEVTGPTLHEVLGRWAEDRPPILVRVLGGHEVRGVLEAVGEDGLIVTSPDRRGEELVPLTGIVTVTFAR